MTGAADQTNFEFSADQIREIENLLPLDNFQRILCITFSIRPAVACYLSALEQSEMLPDKDHLAKRRNEKLTQVDAVLKMIRRPDDLTERFERADEELIAKGEPLLDVLGILVSNFDRMSSVDFEKVIACRVLKRLRRSLETESPDERIKAKNKRDPKHRNELIEKLVDIWAGALEIPIFDCKISKVESSPLLRFIQAVCDPVWVATKEAIGPEQIFNIVDDYRKASGVGSEMASQL